MDLYTTRADGDRSSRLTAYDGEVLDTAGRFGLAVIDLEGEVCVLGPEDRVLLFCKEYGGKPVPFEAFPEPAKDPW